MPSTPNPPAQRLLQLAARSLHNGHTAEALTHLQNVLLHDPTNPTALHHLALSAYERGEIPHATRLLQRGLQAHPDNLELLTSYATLLQEQAKPAEALEIFLRLLALDSSSAIIWNAAGICLQETGQPVSAIEAYLRAIALQPSFAEPHSNLGALLTNEGDLDAAMPHFQQALQLKPDFADCYQNLGVALRNSFRYAASIDAFRQALRLKPNDPKITNSLGEVLGLIYHPEAEALLRRSITLQPNDPEKHWNLALQLLKQGDYLQGWREHECRWSRPKKQTPLRPFPQPYWRNEPGQSIAGATILLHAEQGFGDTLQFLRYLPSVLALGARIVLEVQPSLHSLATQYALHLHPDILVIAHGDPLPPFDWHTPLMSLPHAFVTTLDTIPPPRRFTPPATPATPHQPLRIGIAWAGNPQHDRDRERSIPLDALLPFFNIPNIAWVSLQVGPATTQLQAAGVPIAHPPLSDFLATAALIDTLDLVIAVDTAVAHLSASQGTPTWLLLPFVADWRWLSPEPQILSAKPNPWYPNARIFRQTQLPDGNPQPDLWKPVIAEVAQALHNLLPA